MLVLLLLVLHHVIVLGLEGKKDRTGDDEDMREEEKQDTTGVDND